jgi:urease accessory protein
MNILTNSRLSRNRFVLPIGLSTLLAGVCHAHPGHGAEIGGIARGLAHPFTGLDHILAMLAVGLWAVQLGKRALWLLPLSFVSAMAAGAALGMSGVRLPFIEPAILASVLALGMLVAFAARLPLGVSAAAVAVAALFHGQAHGSEISMNSSGLSAIVGFVIATAMLHTFGVAGGLGLQRIAQHRIIRAAGAAIVSTALLIGLGTH